MVHKISSNSVLYQQRVLLFLLSEYWQVSDFGSARWIQSIEECQQVSSSSGFSRSGSSVASTPINAKLVGGDVVTSIEEDDPSAPLISQRCPEALMSSDVGTLLWSAPEVLAQKAYGAAADVFRYVLCQYLHFRFIFYMYFKLQSSAILPIDDQCGTCYSSGCKYYTCVWTVVHIALNLCTLYFQTTL